VNETIYTETGGLTLKESEFRQISQLAHERFGLELKPGKEALVAAGDESGVRVLAVDNDPVFRHYLKTLLTKHGYYVLAAATADDAVDASRRFRPRVVIVDLALPQRPGAELGDGADLVAQLQTGTLMREIYCFMVTGYDPADVRERLALLQVTPEIWQKPLDGEKFLKRLDEILNGSKRSAGNNSGQ